MLKLFFGSEKLFVFIYRVRQLIFRKESSWMFPSLQKDLAYTYFAQSLYIYKINSHICMSKQTWKNTTEIAI